MSYDESSWAEIEQNLMTSQEFQSVKLSPHDLGPVDEWGHIVDRGMKVFDGKCVDIVVVSESPLLDNETFVRWYSGHVVLSDRLPLKEGFDKDGNRIRSQTEALEHYLRTYNGKLKDIIRPPESPESRGKLF